MTILHRLASIVRWVVRRNRAEQDLHDELEAFVDIAAADRIRDGASPAEARRLVGLHLGGVEQAKERVRAGRHGAWLDEVGRDVRYGLRQVRRSPVFSGIAIATLALGVGANTAIFSVVYAVLLRPLPYHEPDRLVSASSMLAGEYLFLRGVTETLDGGMALYRPNVGFNLSDDGGAERVTGAFVSANLFSTLGVSALAGRTFRGDEEQPGESAVVVLGHSFWRQRFAADAGIIGRDVLIDGQPRRVIGVMPPTFGFPSARTQLWLPYAFDPRDSAALWGGGQRGQLVARLAPRTTSAQAQAELRALAPELRKANTEWVFPPTWGRNREVVLLQDRLVGNIRTRLLVILGAVGIVLLIACANVANLLLARGSARQREFAIRRALGAGRSRIVRQLLTESLVLGLAGSAAGLLVAFFTVPVLVSSMPADVPRVEEIGIDRAILGFTLALGLVTGLTFGAMPAIRSTWQGTERLRIDDRGSGASFGLAASVMVATEIAVAVLLVIAAGLLIRSFAELLRVDPGFRSERIMTARITLPESRYADQTRTRLFYGELLARIGAFPGVEAVEATSHLPLVGGPGGFAFEVEGTPYVQGTGAPTTAEHIVTPGYLQTMGISVLRGRPLVHTDHENTVDVAVINETMAREHWPGQDPIGKRLKRVWNDDWITVVGIAQDVKYDGLANEVEPAIYRPFLQTPDLDMSLVVRTASDPTRLAASLRETVASLDRTVPVSEIRALDEVVASSLATSRFTTFLLAAFATLALTLAAIGTYGVLSYAVSRRAREIGVRMALGARRVDIMRMVLGHAALLAAAGTVGGVAAALATTHVLESLLFGVTRTDAVTFAAVPMLLAGVALIAAYVPASRATRVDPTTVLRLE